MTVAPLTTMAPVPPQNLEAEESVLGAMMISSNAIGSVTEILDASDFYRESHAKIYRAALGLWGKGEPVDAITLADELDERSELEVVGGSARIAELAALVPAASNVEHYARIVKEVATLRGLVRVGQEITRLGQERDGETHDLVDRAEQLVFALAQQRVTGDFAHIQTLLLEGFERITQLYEAGAELTGIPTGFRELDRLTSGFQPGNLVILAARPSMGKSALALCAAANLGVRHEVPVALFTLEMSKAEVTQRLMCSEAKVESNRLRSGKLTQDDWPRLTAACDKLMKAPIYVDDTGSITMMELRSKARRLKSREPKLGLIIVDYLQLMTSGASAENRVQEVSQISRSLKVLARDLDVPILALSQLSRAVEQRHDKRPILSDLRESGLDRAGRGSRLLRLPRRVLQRRRVRPAGSRRGDLRQAPQRADRHDQAQLPQAVREVHRPRRVAGCSPGRPRTLSARAIRSSLSGAATSPAADPRSPGARRRRRRSAARAVSSTSTPRRSAGSARRRTRRIRSSQSIASSRLRSTPSPSADAVG